ncbi:hypothetical protein SAMN05421548_15319 [Paraburkholderia lycopersici]|uniref:Double-GTPase 1 domain-containing protein n=1 Tax=Paraburkholderia lycopersici TaxID=416944 RepID=A0A1G7D780_9BURK|nr:hypothetical protein SAMN05421548_15319 [Paraburkholderia lycopersici]
MQVMLCELIRFLEISLVDRPDGERPRVSIVSAWDFVDHEKFANGPRAWLEHEYPLLAGRLGDVNKRLNIRVFGLSVVGGDLKTGKGCREALQESGLGGRG